MLKQHVTWEKNGSGLKIKRKRKKRKEKLG